MTTSEEKRRQEKEDAARILALAMSNESVTPIQIRKHCGMTDLDWFSGRWRNALDLAKKSGLIAVGRGRNRRYQIKDKATK